ncbi:MAG TPA: DUF5362 family protein [Puia sp.]
MEQNTESLFELQVDHNASAYLGETARWAKFLAILGFICSGILVLVALFAGSFIATLAGGMGGASYLGGMISFVYIVIALVMFFPNLYLFNFASRMQVALRSNDQEQLTRSFGSLKSCYRFIGILMIIYLGLILLFFIFGLLGRAH